MLRWQLLKQLSKSMSGSDLDANEKTYSESTANDDASEEPVGEVKVRRGASDGRVMRLGTRGRMATGM